MLEHTIREQLEELAEEKYRKFSSSLTPGKENILGVRLPLIRKMASKIVKGDWRHYLEQATEDSMEEVLLQGFVIHACHADLEEKLTLAADFIPKIDCWPVCDSFCSGFKTDMKSRERVWQFIQPYFKSEKEYEIRFGVVMLLHYLQQQYAPTAFAHFDQIKHEGYYVKMAVAWVISMYFVHLPDLTMKYLRQNDLDDFTYNKALQKITESFRVDEEIRKEIKSMKRKKK